MHSPGRLPLALGGGIRGWASANLIAGARQAGFGGEATADILDPLKAAALFVAWPGLAAVSAFVLHRAARFQRDVGGDAVGRLVLLMVVASVMTWGATAAFASVGLAQGSQVALALALFLLWAGSMVMVTWIMHRWGAEAVRLRTYHEDIRQMDRMKAQIINVVAHEINTPLTPIRFRVASLKAGGPGPTTERQLESLEAIDRNLDRVDAVVARMMLVVQLQSGRVQRHDSTVPLLALAEEIATRAKDPAKEKGLDIRVGAGEFATVTADRTRLAVALDSLVANGIKFTPSGGTVTVRPFADQDWVGIEVQDTGIGLTEQARAVVFQPLRQEHEPVRTDAGAGLGLYIAQSIAKLHGGLVTVDSDGPGKGSTFRLLLPR